MRKISVALLAVVVIAVLVGVAFLGQPPTVTVEMKLGEGTVNYRGSQVPNYQFSPASITIKKGTRVNVINKDPTGTHTITTNEMGMTSVPLDLATLKPNEEWSYVFQYSGTYHYWCRDHPWMNGTVTVTE